jgi:hypothetical protein
MLWNQQVETNRTSPNNIPGIISCDNEEGICMLLQTAIAEDGSEIKK